MSTRLRLFALVLAVTGALLSVPSAVATGGHNASRAGHQRFVVLSTNAAKNGGPMVGFGAIHAKGTDHVVSDTQDVFQFPAGSLSVTHTPKKSHDSSDPVTCMFTFSERGTYEVTSGTGAYAGASGHGNYRVEATGIGCDQNAAPEVFTLTINAKGPLHLK